jgi:hypothetical protein
MGRALEVVMVGWKVPFQLRNKICLAPFAHQIAVRRAEARGSLEIEAIGSQMRNSIYPVQSAQQVVVGKVLAIVVYHQETVHVMFDDAFLLNALQAER